MKLLKKPNKNILILPRWYPNKTDIQLGIFIQRQLILMAQEFNFQVVYAQAISNLPTPFEIVTNNPVPNLTEQIVYFKSASGPFKKILNFQRYKKAQEKGLANIQQSIDLSHVHVPYRSAIPALRLKRKKDVPFLITEHWSGHLNGLYLKKNALDRMLYKKVLKKAHAISTVSPTLQEAFQKNTGFDSVLIPNYIESFQTTEKSNKGDEIRILSAGDFHDQTKNFSGTIRAFVKAYAQNGKLRLVLIGGGPDEEKIKTLVDRLKAEHQLPNSVITLAGRQDHETVLKAMNDCDFYVCNSNYETFGMTVAEALLSGKPVICTKCGGPETFLNDTNSIQIALNPKTQENDLATAIIALSETYQSFDSAKISAEIDDRFGKTAVQNKWRTFYNS